MENDKLSKVGFVFIAVCLLLLTGLLFVGYQYYLLSERSEESEKLYAENVNQLEQKIAELEENLSGAFRDNNALREALYTEQNKNAVFEEQIREIAGTVGTLQKLSQTDPELLHKYSKVYFLNEHYIPRAVAQISDQYVYDTDRAQWIHAEVWPFLENMMQNAKNQGIELRVISAYRTFNEQASVKEGHVITYGAGTANQFSAEQGYSEHQLGTTVDFTTPSTGTVFSKFKDTEAYQWLQQNAHRYGFILSYPEGNQYYQFEPWHWRFVGKELAAKLYGEGKHFYNMEQREIDEYLVNIFD